MSYLLSNSMDEIPSSLTFQTDLQKSFINIVNDMIEHGVELPKEFKLFYLVKECCTRGECTLNIKPFLTYQGAKENLISEEKLAQNCYLNNGTFWIKEYQTIVESSSSNLTCSKIESDNFQRSSFITDNEYERNEGRSEYEIDYKIFSGYDS
jgi:hypothetical protein